MLCIASLLTMMITRWNQEIMHRLTNPLAANPFDARRHEQHVGSAFCCRMTYKAKPSLSLFSDCANDKRWNFYSQVTYASLDPRNMPTTDRVSRRTTRRSSVHVWNPPSSVGFSGPLPCRVRKGSELLELYQKDARWNWPEELSSCLLLLPSSSHHHIGHVMTGGSDVDIISFTLIHPTLLLHVLLKRMRD